MPATTTTAATATTAITTPIATSPDCVAFNPALLVDKPFAGTAAGTDFDGEGVALELIEAAALLDVELDGTGVCDTVLD